MCRLNLFARECARFRASYLAGPTFGLAKYDRVCCAKSLSKERREARHWAMVES